MAKTYDVCLGSGPLAKLVVTAITEAGAKKLAACLKSVELLDEGAPSVREVNRGYEPPAKARKKPATT